MTHRSTEKNRLFVLVAWKDYSSCGKRKKRAGGRNRNLHALAAAKESRNMQRKEVTSGIIDEIMLHFLSTSCKVILLNALF